MKRLIKGHMDLLTWRSRCRGENVQGSEGVTFLIHVHRPYLSPVQYLDGYLMPSNNMLSSLDLQQTQNGCLACDFQFRTASRELLSPSFAHIDPCSLVVKRPIRHCQEHYTLPKLPTPRVLLIRYCDILSSGEAEGMCSILPWSRHTSDLCLSLSFFQLRGDALYHSSSGMQICTERKKYQKNIGRFPLTFTDLCCS